MQTTVGGQRVIHHYNWMEQKLAQHSEDPNVVWLGVAMHHPILRDASLKQDLLPFLQKYKVDFALVGHQHKFEYANMGYTDEVRYPGKNTGPVLDDCTGRSEIWNTGNLDHLFQKGDTMHQILIGSSGTELDEVCPYKDQDGEVYFQSSDGHGLVNIEVNSKKLKIGFRKSSSKTRQNILEDFFTVEIRA